MELSREPLITNHNTGLAVASNNPHLTIDDIFSRIGFGSYQIKTYLILGLILMNDGAESLVLSILQNILKYEWGLSSTQNDVIGTAVFGGFLLGSLISGKISDLYGRRRPLLYLAVALYAFGLASAFATSYIGLVIIRAIYGFLVGIQFPMCFTYLTEITPKEVRGRLLVLAGGFFTLGELLTCGISFLTLDGLTSGNWRYLLIWVAQPAILCWLGVSLVLEESPRYLIVCKKDYAQGKDILNRIAKHNNVSLTLGEDDMQSLSQWVKSHSHFNNQEVGKLSGLFNEENRSVTIFIWPVWFILSLSYYGMVYILPQVVSALSLNNQLYAGNNQDLWDITYPVLGELPSVLIAVLVVERDYFGRRRSMIGGFLLGALFCGLAASASLFDLWVTLSRLVLNGVFIIASPYTTELYPTTIRATGLGMASAFSRIGGAVMPWITQGLFEANPRAPFLGFCLFCMVGALCCKLIPYDTTKKELDFDHDKKEEKQSSYEPERSVEYRL